MTWSIVKSTLSSFKLLLAMVFVNVTERKVEQTVTLSLLYYSHIYIWKQHFQIACISQLHTFRNLEGKVSAMNKDVNPTYIFRNIVIIFLNFPLLGKFYLGIYVLLENKTAAGKVEGLNTPSDILSSALNCTLFLFFPQWNTMGTLQSCLSL